MQTVPDTIYKITTRSALLAARQSGSPTYPGMAIDVRDGFMHFSTAAHLRETLRLHFAGQGELVLLAVKTADLGTALKWEPSRDNALFPHLYDVLPFDLIAWESDIAVAADGSCQLPESVQ